MKKNIRNLGIVAVLLISGALAFSTINMDHQTDRDLSNSQEIYSNLTHNLDGDKCGEGKCGTDNSKGVKKSPTKDSKKTLKADNKCGEGKCGSKESTGVKKTTKKNESKCGAEKSKEVKKTTKKKDSKCGEGKCGTD